MYKLDAHRSLNRSPGKTTPYDPYPKCNFHCMLLSKSSFTLEDVSQAPQQCEIEGRRNEFFAERLRKKEDLN
jgi:hypothetical protein